MLIVPGAGTQSHVAVTRVERLTVLTGDKKMKLQELDAAQVKRVVDVKVVDLPEERMPITRLLSADDGARVRYPQTGRKLIVVVNSEGLGEYRFLYPDGHLGAVED